VVTRDCLVCGLSIEVSNLQGSHTLKADWQFLEQQAEHSPFISWGWIEAWLEEVVLNNFEALLIKITENNELVALGMLHYGLETRRKLFRRTILFLNEMPLADNNMVIEYNGLLVKKGYEERAWEIFIQKLLDLQKWDEVHLNALSAQVTAKVKLVLGRLSNSYTHNQVAVHDVFLANFSQYQNWLDVEKKLLSKNKRAQISRSIRAFESKYGGVIVCKSATNAKQALRYFSSLEKLHTIYWAGKGKEGAFGNKKWVAFNKKIIEKNIENGVVQLYCISVAEHVIGYLYNFCWKGVVYNIQSGFCYEDDNKLKPGYVSHWLVMAEYFKRDALEYNFLAGSTHYKKSLSNKVEQMESFVLRKRSDKLTFLLEDTLVSVVRLLRKIARR
jgi:CelD/BcsL family acetyltransferase involved in cellulose biosynthesis